ncbi:enoyl-CoA hydratase/isomerase family protein [Sphingopyxis fribergensis]
MAEHAGGSTPRVLMERVERVVVLSINRPEVRNCIDAATAAEMRAAFDAIEDDASVDAVILTGMGDRAFSSGLDLKELAARGPDMIADVIFPDVGWAGIGRRKFAKPLIAAVNGYAMAGGLELMLSCDFAIASDNAMFAFNEATLGPIADAGGCFRLARWVSLPFAREMLLTGRMVDAAEAARVGLVNRVVSQDELIEECLQAARAISRNSPSAMKIMKNLIAETYDRPEDEAWVINDRYMRASFETEDFMEGPRAFTEKRAANFHRD